MLWLKIVRFAASMLRLSNMLAKLVCKRRGDDARLTTISTRLCTRCEGMVLPRSSILSSDKAQQRQSLAAKESAKIRALSSRSLLTS